MSEKTRLFILRTLAIHLVLLAVVLAVVFLASRSIYSSTNRKELDQSTQQQERLAEITGRGIETFYSDVWADLDVLLRQAGPTTAASQPAGGAIANPGGNRGPGGSTAPLVGVGPGNPPAGLLPGGGQIGARLGRGGARGGNRNGQVGPLANVRLSQAQLDSLEIQSVGRQLANRAKPLFILDRGPVGELSSQPAEASNITVVGIDRADPDFRTNPDYIVAMNAAKAIVDRNHDFLRDVSSATISPLVSTPDGAANILCIPLYQLGTGPARPGPATSPATLPAHSRRLLVAVIPVKQVGDQFTPETREFQDTSSILVDQDKHVVASSEESLVGLDLREVSDPIFSGLHDPGAGENPSSYVTDGTLVTVVPVDVQPSNEAGAVRWSLVMRTPQADIDADVNQLFQRTVWWGVFVVVAVTAILFSTGWQLIQLRWRMEHIQNELLTRELDQAREIQLKWLPPAGSMPAGLELSAVNNPASHISGDFYNWFDLPDGRTAVAIGDVTGHGMAAAFLMATTQLLVRNTMARVIDPGKCLQEVNDQLCVQVFHGQFVSLLLMVLDPKQGIVEIADAGHPPPVLIADGKCEVMEAVKSSLVMGVEQRVEYLTQRLPLPDGAGLLLYTDGVVEALSPGGERFTVAGLTRALSGAQAGAKGMINAVIAGVNQHMAGSPLEDDLTMVAIQLHRERTA